MNSRISFYPRLETTIKVLTHNFPFIPADRKAILAQVTEFIRAELKDNAKAELIFICTHNSRRSHISQIWSQAAAAYYGIPDVVSYSGGTEATAFNERAVHAMEKAGFRITKNSGENNPVYKVSFSEYAHDITSFSKKYDSETNPRKGFAAVMTCSHADENCPIVHGMKKRISLPYEDPKEYDGTPEEPKKYSERVMEIGTEILYAFSQVKLE